jgi:hypothetical protein
VAAPNIDVVAADPVAKDGAVDCEAAVEGALASLIVTLND